ncbi:MAG: hypothetical protein IPJ60_18695 [Sphingobacteriaceae bacterium]|nr:hypothetical protein [Sphingobacteriaceae bacterium]
MGKQTAGSYQRMEKGNPPVGGQARMTRIGRMKRIKKFDILDFKNYVINVIKKPEWVNDFIEASEALALSEGLTNGISGTEEIGSRIILISEEK